MDLTTKSPDTDTDTPPASQPINAISFANGALKRHHNNNNHHHLPPAPAAAAAAAAVSPSPASVLLQVSYKECLKNHAASLGGHAVDGCGEFMPSPNATPSDPTSLKCAACGCHRNFHRREPDHLHQHHHHHHLHPSRHHAPRRGSDSPSPPPPPQSPPPPSSYYSAPHMLLALSTGVPGPSDHRAPGNPTAGMNSENANRRKRFRTKFTQDQKEKMFNFSERLGWKMQKSDENLVEEFCNEIGIGRGVLKVWMHNNKHTFGKREASGNNIQSINNNAGINFDTNGHSFNNGDTHNHHHHHNDDASAHLHVSTNGSSSSS